MGVDWTRVNRSSGRASRRAARESARESSPELFPASGPFARLAHVENATHGRGVVIEPGEVSTRVDFADGMRLIRNTHLRVAS